MAGEDNDFGLSAGYHHVQAVGIEQEAFGLLDVAFIAGNEGDNDALDILALQSLDGVDQRPS